MLAEFEFWRLAAGLGLFLFGMHELERSLRMLAGRPFKKFLKQHTERPIKGVLAGALSTAALQSSSVVSLIVLAFVGAGIITLASAIGIVFGSNLGTTATGWIVATVGFKLDIEALALPLIAVGGFGVVWSPTDTKRLGFSHLIAGFGLMLLGLGFMKDGSASATALFDPEALRAYPPIVFLGVGFLITAVIQSSSATIMITLSALYAGVIPLESAAAAAIGADLGTTITALLGALAGSDAKKRVAVALIVFNVVTDAIAFIFLEPLLHFITAYVGINDPLIALVAFHSTFNLMGVVIFLPLIGVMSRFLGKRFRDGDDTLVRHLKLSDLAVSDIAIENLNREMLRLIDQAAALNQISFGLPVTHRIYDSASDRVGVRVFEPDASHKAGYAAVKRLEGELIEYGLKLQEQRLDPPEAARLGQMLPAIRNAVHAAKCLKDTHHDLEVFRESVNDRFNAWFGKFRDAAQSFYEALGSLRNADHPSLRFETLVDLKNRNEELHAGLHGDIYREVGFGELSELQISTLLNVNRELYHSNHSLLVALADALLDPQGAEDYESIPVTT